MFTVPSGSGSYVKTREVPPLVGPYDLRRDRSGKTDNECPHSYLTGTAEVVDVYIQSVKSTCGVPSG